jgi:hypothetical protein
MYLQYTVKTIHSSIDHYDLGHNIEHLTYLQIRVQISAHQNNTI